MKLWVRSLALLSALSIRRGRERGVGCRRGLDPALLWLWPRLGNYSSGSDSTWEPPYAVGVAKEKAKRQIKKNYLAILKCSVYGKNRIAP